MYQVPVQTNFVTALNDYIFNSMASELMNLIVNTGQTLNGADDNQLGKTMANYASVGDFYVDSGSANNYILSAYNNGSGILFQPVTRLFIGARFRFYPANNSTGGATTCNINSLGSHGILLQDATNPEAGDLITTVPSVILWNGTNFILENPQSVQSSTPWPPMFIQGAYVSPGTAPATQFNISTGKMRDLSNAVNCSLNVAITNATIASNTASGGAVPAALFPLTTANAGAALHIFLAFKADGVTAVAAVDNQLDGSTILADPTLSAAGYVYVRRIDSTYCPSNGTIRPIARGLGNVVKYQDNIQAYATTYASQTTPLTVTLPMAALSNITALAFIASFPNTSANQTVYSMLYSLSASITPTPSQNYFDCLAFNQSGNEVGSASSSTPIITSSGQCMLVSSSTTNLVNVQVNVGAWLDDRSLF